MQALTDNKSIRLSVSLTLISLTSVMSKGNLFLATFPTHLALLNEIRAMAGAPRAVGPFSAKSSS